MLGRLSAATAALESSEMANGGVASESDSESDDSSYTEKWAFIIFFLPLSFTNPFFSRHIFSSLDLRSRGCSPNGTSLDLRGYPCGTCETVSTTRPALRKHIADSHPEIGTLEATESRRCPATGCDYVTGSRCEMETHVAAHVTQGMSPTGKKRSLALQRVRYRYLKFRITY